MFKTYGHPVKASNSTPSYSFCEEYNVPFSVLNFTAHADLDPTYSLYI